MLINTDIYLYESNDRILLARKDIYSQYIIDTGNKPQYDIKINSSGVAFGNFNYEIVGVVLISQNIKTFRIAILSTINNTTPDRNSPRNQDLFVMKTRRKLFRAKCVRPAEQT